MLFRTAETGEALRAFEGQKSLQPHTHQRSLFFHAGDVRHFPQYHVIYVESCSHAYEYALMMHLSASHLFRVFAERWR